MTTTKQKTRKSFMVPLYSNGEVVHYVKPKSLVDNQGKVINWVDPNVYTLTARLKFKGFGYAAGGVRWIDEANNADYYMTLTEFEKLVKSDIIIHNGYVRGKFGFVKRGSVLSLELLNPA